MPKKARKEAATLEPAEELVIDNLETLKVLSDPLRLQIAVQLMAPQTVKSMAQALGVATTKLYYHIGLLEKHGLVRVVSTRVVSGIVEKSYQVTAYRFVPKAGLMSGEAGASEGLRLVENMLEGAKQEVRRAYNADLITPPCEEDPDPQNHASFAHSYMVLTPAQAKTFTERFSALLEEVGAKTGHLQAVPDGMDCYALTLAFHRTVNPVGRKGVHSKLKA